MMQSHRGYRPGARSSRPTFRRSPVSALNVSVTRYEGSIEVSALAGEEQYEGLGELGVTRLPWTIWWTRTACPRSSA